MSMMAAVWLTILLVVAARRESPWAWLAYGIALASSVVLDMYLVLVLMAHVVFMCIFRRYSKGAGLNSPSRRFWQFAP